ncbi:cystathionine beta-lyase [Phenylobacterium sp.]|jgi:cystathionine beta-lyase|uniref:cystathionine beta-lyase n=1 Tax=Phenylobacterium sp. TaxID=1871053 RepID=UPI002E36D3B7|nr:cystathionine beta-lyase [Phenylobacterium sp.]HEX3366522.1 cystathionine beta-lyase [Phenylobacterium sp.]
MPSKSGRPSSDLKPETRLIHIGHGAGLAAKTVGPPVQKGSTILLPDAASLYDDASQLTYGRQGLSAQFALQAALAELENARAVTLYPSGLSALTGALLAVLKAGDEVLVTDVIYKPTRRFCDQVLKRFGIKVRYFDPRRPPEELVGDASEATRLILMESPGSLSFEMQDLGRVAELARARNILTVADNTWGAGYLMRPLDLGVDISVQALTKYVGGHSDVFMGSVAVNDPKLVRAMDDGIINLGWAVTGEDAYQMLRGLRTLPTRLARHGESGVAVAAWLKQRPQVVQVFHPALSGAPDHALWARDFAGTSGLFAFSLHPAPAPAVNAFLDALTLFGLGFSWGGFESLAISCDPQLRVRSFHPDYGGPLIRLHIGLEDPGDLIADLERGFAAYAAASQ